MQALAQRSADAAKDVKTKITASANQVDTGVDLVAETGKALERIIARIGDVSRLVSDVAGSAEQQALGLQQVNTAVSEMDNVTQQNAAMVEEATAAAHSLAGEAEDCYAMSRGSSWAPNSPLTDRRSRRYKLGRRQQRAGQRATPP